MDSGFFDILNLEALIKIKENSWNGKNYINLSNMLTDDIEQINYRQNALTDLLSSRDFFDAIKELTPQLLGLREMRSLSSMSSDEVDDLYSVRDLQLYVDLVDSINDIMSKFSVKSELFNKIKTEVSEIVFSDEYTQVKNSIPVNAELVANIKSVTIGINLDESLYPIESGLVSINDRSFVSGNILDKLLRMDMESSLFQCAAPLSVVGKLSMTRDEKQNMQDALNNALRKLLKSSLKTWKPAIKAYTNAQTNFLTAYYDEIRFLVAAAEFFYKLKDIRYPICRPNAYPKEEKRRSLKGIYYPELVLRGTHMTGNDVTFDDNGGLYVFSGANGGGKTLFGKSIAMCQALFQLGLFVPAEYAELSPVNEILLHCCGGGSSITQSLFTEECEQMQKLMKAVDEYSLVICDEAFSGTSAFEGSLISAEVLRAMSAKGCHGVFITHFHDLAFLPEKINAADYCKSKLDNLTVKVDEQSGKRLYKIVREKTAGSSRASDIAQKYGLSFEELMKC